MKSEVDKIGLRAALLATLLAAAAMSGTAAQAQVDLLRGAESRLQAAQKVLGSDLSQEQDLQKVAADLKKLLVTVNEHLTAIGGEENSDHPVVAAHSKILRMIEAIDARLPQNESSPAATRLAPLPVPQYDEKKIVGKAAGELTKALQYLSEHVQQAKAASPETSRLIANLVQAQENLAWEMGWPYTDSEVAQIKKAGELTPDVYLSRRSRGVERINAQLQKDLASTGRETSGKEFVIYCPEDEGDLKQVEQRLLKERGKAAEKIWRKGTTPLDAKVLRQIGGKP